MVSSVLAISQPTYANSIQKIVENGYVFKVQTNIQKQYPELVDLIIMSESINNQQKQEWLDRLPIMNRQQIDKLFNILVEERREIERLDRMFAKDIKALNEKHKTESVAKKEKALKPIDTQNTSSTQSSYKMKQEDWILLGTLAGLGYVAHKLFGDEDKSQDYVYYSSNCDGLYPNQSVEFFGNQEEMKKGKSRYGSIIGMGQYQITIQGHNPFNPNDTYYFGRYDIPCNYVIKYKKK